MASIELNDEQAGLLRTLLSRKIEGTKWVLENKNPKDPAKLQKNIEIQQSILDMLPEEKKEEPKEQASE
jgi:hypothetical protein